ncbi:MAG: hypothetical protein AAB368_09745, partial [bacterium]
TYVDNPGNNFHLTRNPSNDDKLYDTRLDEDVGGVSLAEGFVFATDRGGNLLAIPSSERPESFPIDLGAIADPLEVPPYTTPYTDAMPTYPNPFDPNPGPPGRRPVAVYPTPFDPASAAGGVMKFINLPEGTRVEISTLDNERVIALTASNYRVLWNGRNAAGQPVAAGTYYYRIVFAEPGRPVQTGRITLIRK